MINIHSMEMIQIKKKYVPTVSEDIKRYRLQILVSSYIYMELDETYISDYEWDIRAKKLVELQKKYPEESKKVCYYEIFKDWSGDTSAGFKYDDWVKNKAKELIKYK